MSNHDQGGQSLHAQLRVKGTHDHDDVYVGRHHLSFITPVSGAPDEFRAALKAVGDAVRNGGKVSNDEKGFSHIVDAEWPVCSFKRCHASIDANHSSKG